jgi:integrase/recombinase XerD
MTLGPEPATLGNTQVWGPVTDSPDRIGPSWNTMAGARPLSHDESDALLGALGCDRDRLLVLAGQHLGLRISELLSLKVGMVANGLTPKSEITVPRRSLKGGRSRSRVRMHSRTIPVHPDLASAFALYLSNFPKSQVPAPDTYLFGSQKGTNQAMGPKSAWRILKSAAKAGGLNADRISTHSLRKTFASEMYEASGHDLRACQVCLGHSDIGSTVKYIEPDAQRLANLIRGLPSRARPAVAAHALGSSPSTQAAAAVGSS